MTKTRPIKIPVSTGAPPVNSLVRSSKAVVSAKPYTTGAPVAPAELGDDESENQHADREPGDEPRRAFAAPRPQDQKPHRRDCEDHLRQRRPEVRKGEVGGHLREARAAQTGGIGGGGHL